ncbi:hypothetical protein SG34_026355 [Thalassomonas viridans]|uniref:Uncharacterized protein n=1 Tax=Thalassomonas viridans TaxID=137584 RepID=A0AAE9Z2E1_9GAMM|nr:hypothetical protein [Thalassomonas viridans]WDE04794.1 hypothetical protein SG34_026355 [Thalassomonas viridans]
MLFQDVSEKALTAVLAGLLIAMGIITFDNARLFDWLYFAILAFVILLSRKNINIAGIVLIIILAKFADETGWHLLGDNLLSRLLVYLSLLATLAIIKEEEYRKPVAVLFVLALGAEIYWLVSGYQGPEIYWHVLEINILILVRHYLFMRVFFTSRLFPGLSKALTLDVEVHDIMTAFMFIHALTILEYLARHLFGLDIKLVWLFNAVIFHVLKVYLVYVILHGIAQLSLANKLNA